MKKRYWAFLIGSWCLSVGMQAAKVDTLSVHSDAMNKEVQVITICPDKAMAGEKMSRTLSASRIWGQCGNMARDKTGITSDS